jgi:uncharacterized membrane protein
MAAISTWNSTMNYRNWLVIALGVSLVVNLALGGFVLGRMTAAAPMQTVDPTLTTLRLVRDLPDERRRALRPLLRESVRAMHPEVRRMRAAQHRINASLAAEPFDPDELDAALREFRDALVASQQLSHPGLVRLVVAMTPRERALLRDAMGSPPEVRYRRDRPVSPEAPRQR